MLFRSLIPSTWMCDVSESGVSTGCSLTCHAPGWSSPLPLVEPPAGSSPAPAGSPSGPWSCGGTLGTAADGPGRPGLSEQVGGKAPCFWWTLCRGQTQQSDTAASRDQGSSLGITLRENMERRKVRETVEPFFDFLNLVFLLLLRTY